MHSRLRISGLAATMAALSFSVARVTSGAEMSLGQAITKALSYDPTIRKTYADVIQADGFAKEMRSDLRPQLSLEGFGGEAFRNRSIDGATTGGETLFGGGVSLVGRQLLWSGGYFPNRYKDAKERLAAKQMLEREQRETTAYEVVEAFLDVARARKQISFAQSNLEEHKKVLELAKNRAAAAGNQADVELAGARYYLAENLVRERRLAILQAEARFVRLVGEKPPGTLRMPKVPQISTFTEVDPKENWHYKAVQKQYDAAVLEKKAIRSKYAPRIDLEVRGGIGQNVDGISGPDNVASAMVTARWDLIDGGRRSAEVQQAQADIERQTSIIEETFITIQQDAEARWQDYRTLEERIKILKQYQENLAKTVALYREQFELGTRPLLSILDIQNEATSALIRITDEERDHADLGYRLLYFGGKLIPYAAGDQYIASPRNPDGSPISPTQPSGSAQPLRPTSRPTSSR